MSEENKAIVRRFMEEVINKNTVSAVDEFMAADLVDHNPPPPGSEPGAEGVKQGLKMFFAAFPDLHTHIEDMIAEGDKVAVRMSFHETHQGELMGIPATGKQVTVQEMHIVRIAGGKMVEHWSVEDTLGMMQQLGVIPKQS